MYLPLTCHRLRPFYWWAEFSIRSPLISTHSLSGNVFGLMCRSLTLHFLRLTHSVLTLRRTSNWLREQASNLHFFRNWIQSPARLSIPPSRICLVGSEGVEPSILAALRSKRNVYPVPPRTVILYLVPLLRFELRPLEGLKLLPLPYVGLEWLGWPHGP